MKTIDHVEHSSLFRIDVTISEYSFDKPWLIRQTDSGGTGFAVRSRDELYIATVAHVVAAATNIDVSRSGQDYFPGAIQRLEHDVDLALMSLPIEFADTTVVSEDCTNAPPGAMVTMQSIARDKTVVVTHGELLPEAFTTLAYSNRAIRLLQVSTDISLRQPTSGSPAFVDGKLIGLVSQLHAGVIGIVPTRYLTRLFSSNGTGLPDLGILWQELNSSQLRDYLGVRVEQTGVLVTKVILGSSSFGHLTEGDIVTSINGMLIGNDGRLPNCDNTHFMSAVADHDVGESITLALLRGGSPLTCSFELRQYSALVKSRPSTAPAYLVFAGLVFVTLTYEMLSEHGLGVALYRYKHAYFDMYPTTEREEMVVLTHVMSNEATRGYESMHSVFVTEINGIKISKLADIAEAAQRPMLGRHIVIVDNPGRRAVYENSSYGNIIVLDSKQASKVTRELVAAAEIPRSHLVPFS